MKMVNFEIIVLHTEQGSISLLLREVILETVLKKKIFIDYLIYNTCASKSYLPCECSELTNTRRNERKNHVQTCETMK